MSFKPPVGPRSVAPPIRKADRELRAELEERGLDVGTSKALAKRLGAGLEALDGTALASVLDAVVDLCQQEQPEPSADGRDLREIERLMAAFSDELSKLDEILEVLGAHAKRMRSALPRRPDETLH